MLCTAGYVMTATHPITMGAWTPYSVVQLNTLLVALNLSCVPVLQGGVTATPALDEGNSHDDIVNDSDLRAQLDGIVPQANNAAGGMPFSPAGLLSHHVHEGGEPGVKEAEWAKEAQSEGNEKVGRKRRRRRAGLGNRPAPNIIRVIQDHTLQDWVDSGLVPATNLVTVANPTILILVGCDYPSRSGCQFFHRDDTIHSVRRVALLPGLKFLYMPGNDPIGKWTTELPPAPKASKYGGIEGVIGLRADKVSLATADVAPLLVTRDVARNNFAGADDSEEAAGGIEQERPDIVADETGPVNDTDNATVS
jgi:hypothetical protein